MNDMKLKPDFLFEISWEVCNKVGGINTVIATKARTVCVKYGDRYFTIGPDLGQGADREFEEDPALLKGWRQTLYEKGIRVRVGHWRIVGRPQVILVDFSSLIPRKDDILKFLWESYRVDSISGQWDYIEPVLFGYAAGLVVASYVETFCKSANRVAGHSEMMLQSHFGSIFYLSRTASEKLTGCSRSHGAGNTYLALATYISTTDRSILLYDVAHQSGCSQGSQDALFTHIMRSKHVVEYRWQYTTGTTGRSCNDGATRSILFAHSQRISINQAAALQGSTVTLRLYIIGGSLTL